MQVAEARLERDIAELRRNSIGKTWTVVITAPGTSQLGAIELFLRCSTIRFASAMKSSLLKNSVELNTITIFRGVK